MWRPGAIRGTKVEPAGDVPGEWVAAPVSLTGVTLLWFHGGAYLHGSPRQRRGPASRLSRASGARVLCAAYRLAPEHPFPAALEDALAAYRRMVESGAAPERIVVGGDSAGGGLVAAMLVALRDAGDHLPAGGVLFSPWTDLSLEAPSITELARVDTVLDAGSLREAADRYLGGTDARHPGASPLFAELGGLPPVFVQAGDADILLDDSRVLVERVREAGGRAVLDVWEGMPHVFQNLAPIIPEAGCALERAGAFIRDITGT
jgi:acetyl esterase/lipase